MAHHNALGDINNLQCGVQWSGFPYEYSPVNLYTFSERASDVACTVWRIHQIQDYYSIEVIEWHK